MARKISARVLLYVGLGLNVLSVILGSDTVRMWSARATFLALQISVRYVKERITRFPQVDRFQASMRNIISQHRVLAVYELSFTDFSVREIQELLKEFQP